MTFLFQRCNALRNLLVVVILGLAAMLASCGGTKSDVTVTTPAVGTAPSSTISVGSGPEDVVACDLNKDGKMDLLSVNSTSDNLTVLLGKGDGTFTSSTVSLPSSGVTPVQAVCADFNGDGKADVAVTNMNSQNITVLLGNGDGTFTTGTTVSTGKGSVPFYISTADLNKDGKADLIVGNKSGLTSAEVFLGNGDGTFSAAPVVSMPNQLNIAIGDFNGDGRPDIAYNDGKGGVAVQLGNGDGTFGTATSFGALAGTWVAVADVNKDGNADIVTSSGVVLLGDGHGSFTSTAGLGLSGTYVVVGDFDGNGKLDIATIFASETVLTVFNGVGDGSFSTSGTNYTAGSNPRAIAVGDFNGDGKADFAVVSSYDGTIDVILGR